MTGRDQQQIRDFQRFLQVAERPGDGVVLVPNWRWVEYAKGAMGAPPLLWEGDNA